MDWWTALKSSEPVEPMRWQWRLLIALGFLVSVVGWMLGVLPPVYPALMNAIFFRLLIFYNVRQRRLVRFWHPDDDRGSSAGTRAGSFVRRHLPRRHGP